MQASDKHSSLLYQRSNDPKRFIRMVLVFKIVTLSNNLDSNQDLRHRYRGLKRKREIGKERKRER